jgi:hypothetical protein
MGDDGRPKNHFERMHAAQLKNNAQREKYRETDGDEFEVIEDYIGRMM